MAFTAGTGDPISSDAADGYSLTANDAIMVYLNYTDTPSSPYCCPDPAGGKWQLFARAKKGTILGPPSTGISITALDEKYYVRLERITASQVMLSVFSDPAYTIHLPGSPLNYTIDCSIQGLNTIQQGVITWAGWYRHLTCELDDLHICSADSATSPPVQAVTGCPGENVGLSVVTSPGDIVSWDSPDVSCTNCASVTVPVPGSGSSLYCAQIDNGSCAPVINCFTVTAQPCDSSSTDHPLTSHPLIDPLLNDSVHIDSIFIQPECEMAVVPNIITPNGDGLNDFFRPLNCPVNQMQLAIYNRWGLKVFETSDPVAKWEGKTSSGNHCNDGVYYYLLGYITPNGSGVTRNGFIQLSR
jgi:gliding motility-associated-like protein